MKKEDWSQLPAPDHIHKFEFETGIEITDEVMLEYRIAKCICGEIGRGRWRIVKAIEAQNN